MDERRCSQASTFEQTRVGRRMHASMQTHSSTHTVQTDTPNVTCTPPHGCDNCSSGSRTHLALNAMTAHVLQESKRLWGGIVLLLLLLLHVRCHALLPRRLLLLFFNDCPFLICSGGGTRRRGRGARPKGRKSKGKESRTKREG